MSLQPLPRAELLALAHAKWPWAVGVRAENHDYSKPVEPFYWASCPGAEGEIPASEAKTCDPFYWAAWDRWQKAREAWRTTWPHVPFVCFRPEPFDVYNPNVEAMTDPAQKAVAVEYLEARVAYNAALKVYES